MGLKRKNKLLCMLLITCLIVTFVPTTAFAGGNYTVTFDANGGSGYMADVTNAPSQYTLPACGFTPPANKQFKCWAVGPLNDPYDPGDKININGNVTVKAVWDAITSQKQVVNAVVATSPDITPTLYGLLKIPTFNVTQGAPAYINSSASNLVWQKNINGVWTNQYSGRFTPGEWRISTSVRIDREGAYTHELGNPTTLTVNGQPWEVDNNGKPSVHPDYSVAFVTSPVFTIADDPNVQPPVKIDSVQMTLKGYQTGAKSGSATVQTDANVDATVLGFLRAIDSNGDGQPDSIAPLDPTDTFKPNEVYLIVVSLKAKTGYDLSSLTAQDVSLDRSLMDLAEQFVIEDETFNGMYLLDDIVQCTVNFETNGGSTIDPVQISRGKTLTPPAEPTRAYYAFDGWYKDSALTQQFDFNTPISGDTTLYAKWTPSPVGGMFLITMDFNGGTSTIPSSFEVPANSAIYLNDTLGNYVTPPSGKVLAGYEIDGVPYVAGGDYLVTQNITLKFLWKDDPNINTNTPGGNGGNTPTGGNGTPETGDNNVMVPWIVLMLLSGIGTAVTATYYRKRTNIK
ncbi:MAG: InlB B-repeat-containing protein [Firmicutes bacterium]|nr:InlB B-repeat-containing protein [Bacillota bacterium]